jgi:hypothetical protein
MSLVMIEKYESEQARFEHARGAGRVRSLPVPSHTDTRDPLNGGKNWTARQAPWYSPTSRPYERV